jgi:signal transduction histidine kinase
MSAQGEDREPRGFAESDAATPARAASDRTCELVEAAFSTSTAGLALAVGPDLRLVQVNRAYRALTPHPETDPLGRTFEELWRPSHPGLADAVRRALETGEPSHQDLSLGRAGEVRHLSHDAKLVALAGGPAVLLVAWETTALAEARQGAEEAAEGALRRAAELDAVIDAIADGFVLYGPQGEVRYINAAAARFVAGPGVDARTGFAELFARLELHGPDGKAVAAGERPVARALSGDTVHTARLHVRIPATGREAWIAASAAPIRAPGGAVGGAVLTFSDESEVHELEQARDDLVRMISHDLRTPLNAVYTQAHLLSRAPQDTAKVIERASSIVRSCERMSAMIQDLVETALLEAGQLELIPSQVDLAALVPELLARVHGGIPAERVQLTIVPGLPQAWLDPPRFERVLVNLLSNALKYSPPQSQVALELGPADGGVVVSVADRGVGIAPEDLGKVFERFYRARSARRPEGLGLGLYISRLLVEAHGGRIEVESQLGQGSVFRVFLPAAPPLRSPPAAP